MVEEGRGLDDSVGAAVRQDAEVAEMPVRIADQRVKDDHFVQRLNKRVAERFIEAPDRLDAAGANESAGGNIGGVLARKNLARGTEASFPSDRFVGDNVKAELFADQIGVLFRIRLESRIGRAGGRALVEINLPVHSTPTFRQRPVGGKFRRRRERRTNGRTVTGKGDARQNGAETVFVQV